MSNELDLSDFSMLDLFRMELEGQLVVMNQGLIEMEDHAPSMQTLESLMRAAHSIKGAARMVNVQAAVKLAHAIEDCFVAAQQGKIRFNPDQIDILLAGVDCLHKMESSDDAGLLNWHDSNGQELQGQLQALGTIVARDDSDDLVDVGNELDRQLLKREEKESTESEDKSRQRESIALRVDASRLNRIFSLAGETLVESHRFNATMNSLLHLKRTQHKLIEELDDLRSLLQEERLANRTKEKFTRVYTRAIELRKLLSERVAELDALDRRSATVVEKLHKEIIATRMRSFSSLVQPLPRLVRDLGRKLGKDVRLQMSGLATLVDREVLERIDTSLKHLVQNAIDHGIEPADERKEKGKPGIGNLYLNVSQSAGMLFIVLTDDGRGVDFDALKAKIVKKKYASKDFVETLDKPALLEYLFEPGFSTRNEVNEISGRGVGLDLVKETVENLGGSVFVSSEPGNGTRFQLLLPLTVSIMRVLVTTIAGESYGFPLSRIHRLLVVDSAHLSAVENRVVYESDQGIVEVVHGNLLVSETPAAPADNRAVPVVVLEHDDRQFGIIVESFDGEKELSIQRWDSELGDVPGVNSAAILDDGTLTLIVDTKHMQEAAQTLIEAGTQTRDWLERFNSAPKPKTVLLYERSRTTRERLRRILQKYGYAVLTPVGAEELETQLASSSIDVLAICIDSKKDPNLDLLKRVHDARTESEPRLFVLTDLEPDQLDAWLLDQLRVAVVFKQQFKPMQFLERIAASLKAR